MPNTSPTINRNRSYSPSSRQISNLSPVPRSFTERDNSRNRSRSPTALRNPTVESRHSVERENRSPTPNFGLSAGSHRLSSRSRSPTPRTTLSVNSRNRTPSRNRSRSPTPHREALSTPQNVPSRHRSRSTSPKETVNTNDEFIKHPEEYENITRATATCNTCSSSPIVNFDMVNITDNVSSECRGILQTSENQINKLAEEIQNKYHDVMLSEIKSDNKSKEHDISSEPQHINEDEPVIDTTPFQKISDNFINHQECSTGDEFSNPVQLQKSGNMLHNCESGVDTSPSFKVSDNFINHPLRIKGDEFINPVQPLKPINTLQSCESGVDTSPSFKVSDNFVNQHKVSIPIKQIPTYLTEIESGVDVTPSRRVSDNFEASDLRGINYSGRLSLPGSGKKFGSAIGLETMGSELHTNNDSGSEISDEGYRSLGIVTTPPAVGAPKTITKLKGKIFLIPYL